MPHQRRGKLTLLLLPGDALVGDVGRQRGRQCGSRARGHELVGLRVAVRALWGAGARDGNLIERSRVGTASDAPSNVPLPAGADITCGAAMFPRDDTRLCYRHGTWRTRVRMHVWLSAEQRDTPMVHPAVEFGKGSIPQCAQHPHDSMSLGGFLCANGMV